MAKVNTEFVKQANQVRAAYRQLRRALEFLRRVKGIHVAHDYSDANAGTPPAYVGVDNNGVIGTVDITPADYLSGITTGDLLITWAATGGRDTLIDRLAGPNE